MITSKQRAFLRGLSNTIQPTTHVGKEGITDSVIDSIEETMITRELIKIKLLDNSGLSSKEAGSVLADKLNAECIQCIGSKIVLYRGFRKDPQIILPRK